ncbi:MAG: OmpA family protein [Polyangiaceae bacterium]|nr:OmpA family protein [Polyangiaceae bacterium]
MRSTEAQFYLVVVERGARCPDRIVFDDEVHATPLAQNADEPESDLLWRVGTHVTVLRSAGSDVAGAFLPLGGVELVFAIGSREEKRGTDGTGTARLEDVPESFATVRFADEASVRQKLRGRWQAARGREWQDPPADMTNTVAVVRRNEMLPAISVVAEEPHRIVLQPRVVLAQLFGMWFETSKCFLLPTAMEGVRFIRTLYDANPETDLLVVGHTDTAGDPTYNDPLSLERARSVAAYLTDRVDEWLAWYDPSKPDAKRWGAREDAMMIVAVAEYGGLDIPPGAPLVWWFQETLSDQDGLKVDGIAGPQTRSALIKRYMAIDGTTLPLDVVLSTHGCGESFPLLDTGDEQAEVRNRRTEVFFFENPIGAPARPSAVLPPAPGEVSPPGSPAYPEWVLRARETLEAEHGKPVPTGFLWIRFEIAPDQAVLSKDNVRLFSSTRAFDVTKNLSVSHVANEQSVDVPFDNVPIADTYTLEIQRAEGDAYFVFQDRSYSSLNDDSLPESEPDGTV